VLSRHPIDAVQQTLAAVRVGGTFATRLTLPAADLALTVKGVGPLAWPISATMAKQLVAEARPAPYGLGERTLVDPRVRRSGEIAGGRAQIGARPWNERLRGALAQIRDALGLPGTGRLVAKLDKMLVYAPGEFFAPHRDSEKVDGMVASLVVVLPSRSTGGGEDPSPPRASPLGSDDENVFDHRMTAWEFGMEKDRPFFSFLGTPSGNLEFMTDTPPGGGGGNMYHALFEGILPH
jgi:hypothetical protein